MMDSMLTERKRDMENSTGLMTRNIQENSMTTTFMERDTMSGLTVELTMEIGKPTKCTVTEFSLGKMEEFILESMLMTRKKV